MSARSRSLKPDAEQLGAVHEDEGEQQECARGLDLVDGLVPFVVVPVGAPVHGGADVGVHEADAQGGGVAGAVDGECAGVGDVHPPRGGLDEAPAGHAFDLPGRDERFRRARGEVATHQGHVAEREQPEHTGADDGSRAPVEPRRIDPVRGGFDDAEEVDKFLRRLVETLETLVERGFEQPPPLARGQSMEHRDDGVGSWILRLSKRPEPTHLTLRPADVPLREEPLHQAKATTAEQLGIRQPLIHAHPPPLDNECCHFRTRQSRGCWRAEGSELVCCASLRM